MYVLMLTKQALLPISLSLNPIIYRLYLPSKYLLMPCLHPPHTHTDTHTRMLLCLAWDSWVLGFHACAVMPSEPALTFCFCLVFWCRVSWCLKHTKLRVIMNSWLHILHAEFIGTLQCTWLIGSYILYLKMNKQTYMLIEKQNFWSSWPGLGRYKECYCNYIVLKPKLNL